MNKRGGMLLAITVAVMLFMAGMLFVNFLGNDITSARATTALDCENVSISDGSKLTCLGVDIVIPYFIISVISIAGGIIVAKLNL